jgi:hypothetical protein
MNRLEVISLRTSGYLEQQAREYLRSFCLDLKKTTMLEANSYASAFVPGDLAIVILSQTEQGKKQKTDAGISLADALKRFGLVDHTCWLMIENS